MVDVLSSLEPRVEEQNTILFDELEEISEVLFIHDGTYEIGFEINYQTKFVLRYKNSNTIGAYGITFDQRSEFIYKTSTRCKGYFIRKKAWKDILKNNEQCTDEIKGQILKNHEIGVRKKMYLAKIRETRKFKSRADIDAMKYLLFVNEEHPIKKFGITGTILMASDFAENIDELT